jgi:TRAP-type uncharacterized transport system substrate-binding protein
MNDEMPPPVGRRSAGLALSTMLLAGQAPGALAQPVLPPPPAPTGAPVPAAPVPPIGVNVGHEAIGIMGGPLVGTFTRIADDIARFLALRAPHVARIIPMIGSGGPQVAQDVVELRSVDGAVVSAVVMDSIRRSGWLADVTRRVSYVAELYVEETHIVASTQISNVQALNGKVVNVGALGGGTEVIAKRLFEGLGVRPIFDNRPTLEALRGVQGGDPAAVVFIAGKPVAAFQDVPIVGNLHFVPITLDATTRPRVEPLFRQTVIEHLDYPRFIPRGRTVPTVASSVFLVTRNHPDGSERQFWVSQIVTELVQSFVALRAGAATGAYHPKWREVNVLTPLVGYGRSPEVTAWFNNTGTSDPPATPR